MRNIVETIAAFIVAAAFVGFYGLCVLSVLAVPMSIASVLFAVAWRIVSH